MWGDKWREKTAREKGGLDRRSESWGRSRGTQEESLKTEGAAWERQRGESALGGRAPDSAHCPAPGEGNSARPEASREDLTTC